jgi:hypothetical protein
MKEILVDFNAPGFAANPYPVFHRLRANAPVYRAPNGVWYLTRYEDAAFLLKDGRFSRMSPGASPLSAAQRDPGALEKLVSKWLIFRDGLDHARMRRSLGSAFTPRAIGGMRTRVQGIIDVLLDRVGHRGAMDVVLDLAYPLPVMVISDLLGVPSGDRDLLREWSNQLTRALDRGDPEDMERAAPAVAEMREYFGKLIGALRRDPPAGLAGALLADGKSALPEEDWLATWIFLMWAGHETTKNLIASGLLTLLRNPAQLDLLRRRPDLIAPAIEECLRYESPVQKIGRWTTAEVRVGESVVPKDQFVVALLGAANRDPARFAEPDLFDIERPERGHIGFGGGAHHCLGAGLARLEAQLAIDAVIRRMPCLARVPGPVAWRPYAAFRSLETLPVTF